MRRKQVSAPTSLRVLRVVSRVCWRIKVWGIPSTEVMLSMSVDTWLGGRDSTAAVLSERDKRTGVFTHTSWASWEVG